MKKAFILWVLLSLFSRTEIYAQADEYNQHQLFFQVKPELFGFAGASFGVKSQSDFAIYAGIDYLHLGSTIELTSETWDYNSRKLVRDKDETEALYTALNIHLGAKYFMVRKNSIKGYLVGEISKPMLSGSLEVDGKENEAVEDFFDNLSLWAFKAGFGMEYFFSQNFSLGGKFGLRLIIAGFEDETSRERTIYNYPNPPRTVTETESYDLSMNIRMTYTSLSLNFYF